MNKQDTLQRAIELASKNSGQTYAYTMGELIADLTILQDFAKALWGEELIQIINMEPAWRYHLSQMVIADDPLQYLADNLLEEGEA